MSVSCIGTSPLTRRGALAAALAWAAVPGSGAAAPTQGLVLPRAAAPDFALTGVDGSLFDLSARLRGRISAVQLMFAGCSSVCPPQGVMFAAVAGRLSAPEMQLFSLTVDPLGDSPQALRAWLAKFGEHRRWTAAVPRVRDVDALSAYLRGGPVKSGTHGTQVFLFDRQARLAFRTSELPSAEHVASLLTQLAAA